MKNDNLVWTIYVSSLILVVYPRNEKPLEKALSLLLEGLVLVSAESALSFPIIMLLEAAWSTICGLREEHYVFFNCTALAGSGREHKHLQGIPAPGKREGYDGAFKLFPDDDTTRKTGPSFVISTRFEDLPEGCVKNGEHLLEIYRRLLQQARDALELPTEVVPCPHNFVLTRRWMMAIS